MAAASGDGLSVRLLRVRVVMVPVQKKSKCAKRKRRSHHSLTPANLVTCPKCGNLRRSHTACSVCGLVNHRLMLDLSGEKS